MEQNPARVGLQPSVGTGYTVTFKVTEQEGEGDKTTSQDCEEGRMGTIRLLGGTALLSSGLIWRTQLSSARWSLRAKWEHMGDKSGPRDKDKVVARGQSRHYPGCDMAPEDRDNSPGPQMLRNGTGLASDPIPTGGPAKGFQCQ